MKNLKKINYRHYISILITLLFISLAIFVFPNAFIRIKESICDFGLSFAYYFNELLDLGFNVSPTVNTPSIVPMTPIFNLPASWEEFTILWNNYWHIIFTSENLNNYLIYLGDLLYIISKYILLVGVPIVLIFMIVIKRYFSKHNNSYDKDSKCLTFHKKLCAIIYEPIKYWLLSFVEFVKVNKIYWQVWLFIWLWNFNGITIFLEFLAFYFYFVISFNFSDIYLQIYKLFVDITPMLAFIPAFVWVIFAIWLICVIRKKIGYSKLNHCENKNCGFINERPIVVMVCGTMGKKKTTMITDMVLSQEVMLKNKAFELLLENDLKFPYFSWCNLENTLKQAIKEHKIYNLSSIKKYIKHLAIMFDYSIKYPLYAKSIRKHLKKDFCYINKQNILFGYDYERYGLFYNDKLKVVNIWQVIETYSQLYFVYVMQSSLIISNYSVRTDNLIDDVGNFPLWNTDFFKRDSRLIDSFSRHSHIIDFDSLRLGRKLIEDNPLKDSFEFGVIDLTEIGKERKNNLELRETKRKEEFTNQKNDGFNDWLKMVRHSATIDNFPFVKVLTDEQRPESWGADARDLCEIVHIKETSDFNLLMPFFTITELLYQFIFSKFESMYYQYRYMRSDNTLFMYLLKSLTAKFNHYYKGIHNTFGCCTMSIQVESGTQDGMLNEKKYYLMSKKIYSKRFSTDCFSDYFNKKALKSKFGLNDIKEYETEKASFDELKEQNSYFINDLIYKKNDIDLED